MLIVNRAGNALALTLAAFYLLCSLLFVVWPKGYMGITAMLFHGFEFSAAPHAMSAVGFVLGALCIAIVGYLIGAGFAIIWNALAADRKSMPAPREVHR